MKYERAPEYEQQFTRLNTPYASEWPDRRPLKIALDPLRGKTDGNEVTITIPGAVALRRDVARWSVTRPVIRSPRPTRRTPRAAVE
jgi:hypothetical protein